MSCDDCENAATDTISGDGFPQEELNNFAGDYLEWASVLSYETELGRVASLERLAVNLLSSISILSVALLTVAPSILSRYDSNCAGWFKIGYVLLIIGYPLVMLLLGVAFLLALLSQMRLKQAVLASPSELSDYVSREIESGHPFSSHLDVTRSKVQAMQPHFESLYQKNELVRKLLKASMVILIVALGVTLLMTMLFSFQELLLSIL